MDDFKYLVEYLNTDNEGEGPWFEDGRFQTLEEALYYATSESLVATNVYHRVVKICTETVVTLPPLGEI